MGNSTNPNTTVTMNGNETVTANFSPITTEVPWTLQLDGTAIGGLNYTMTEAFFEEGVAHHGAALGMTAPCLRAVTIPIAACHCGCSAVGLTIKWNTELALSMMPWLPQGTTLR